MTLTTGETAGIIGATIPGLFGIGKGIQWLWTKIAARALHREARLDRREAELEEHESTYRQRIEARLEHLDARDVKRQEQQMALRLAFDLVAGALRAMDPQNVALRQAEQLLAIAFPLKAIVPPDLNSLLDQIDRNDLRDPRHRHVPMHPHDERTV